MEMIEDNRYKAKEQALDFLYDFLNNYLRLDDYKNEDIPYHIRDAMKNIKKNDLMHKDIIFNKTVNTLAHLLIENEINLINDSKCM